MTEYESKVYPSYTDDGNSLDNKNYYYQNSVPSETTSLLSKGNNSSSSSSSNVYDESSFQPASTVVAIEQQQQQEAEEISKTDIDAANNANAPVSITTAVVEDGKPKNKKPSAGNRLQSLDVFRGITIIGMILVDNQGNFDYVVSPLNESTWNGLRPSDSVFPCFIFIVGVAIALALNNIWIKAKTRKEKALVWYRVIKRIILLFAIGLFLNLFAISFYIVKPFVIMGVLQRIALCYGIVTVLFLTAPVIVQRLTMVLFLVIYIALMYGVNVPNGCGRGNLTPECNTGAFIDHHIFGNYMAKPNDPQGLLSTLPATVTCYIGLEFGRILTRNRGNTIAILGRFITLSFFALAAGLILGIWMPFNKKIWSASFAVVLGGIGGTILTFCYYVVDVADAERENRLTRVFHDYLLRPLIWIGMNPMAIFILMVGLEIILMDTVKFTWRGQSGTSLWLWIYWEVYASWIKPLEFASLMVAFTHVVLWVVVAFALYRNKLFLKI